MQDGAKVAQFFLRPP